MSRVKRWLKDWTPLPPDMTWPIFLLGPAFLTAWLFEHLRRANSWLVFWAALSAAVLGVVLLFLARLPLYREKQFFTLGPRRLDAAHRRLYWAAYCFVGGSVFLFLVMLLMMSR